MLIALAVFVLILSFLGQIGAKVSTGYAIALWLIVATIFVM